MLDEVLERGKRSWPHPLELVRGDRLEQLAYDAALQDDFGLGREQSSLAFGTKSPLIPRVRDERDAGPFVGKRVTLVPGQPAFLDRDAADEIACALRADASGDWPFASSIDDGFGPDSDVLELRQSGPHFTGRCFDAYRRVEVDHGAHDIALALSSDSLIVTLSAAPARLGLDVQSRYDL